MSRSRLRTHVTGSAALRGRIAVLADSAGLALVGSNAKLVVHEIHAPRGSVGLDDVAAVQGLASEVADAVLVIVVPRGTDAYTRAALRRAGAFDVLFDGPDLEDDLTGVAHVARRVQRLEEERERLAGELAHHGRLSTVGLLAAGVGHEINNPCGAILANTETVRDAIEQVLSQPRFQQGELFQRRAPEWLEALGDTLGATRRITSIVRSLNVFSRRSTEGEPLATNLNAEVHGVLRLVGKEVQLQTQVILELAPDLPDVIAPPYALTQVVSNLVVNALQSLEASFPDPTHRRLVVRTAFDEESVLLEVADNGAGIPPDVLERVFDPFFTTKPVGSGTGLGLSITRELVRRCGGDVFVDSAPGDGATFRVVVPAAVSAADAVRPISKAPAPHLRHRVLLVDDDTDLLRALARSLGNELECVTESSGEGALARVRAGEHFDAVLLDVVMPGLDGVETWRALTALQPELGARVVFISGGVRADERRSAVEASGRPLLSKPAETSTVLEALRSTANVRIPPPAPLPVRVEALLDDEGRPPRLH